MDPETDKHRNRLPSSGGGKRPLLVWVGIDVDWGQTLAAIARENDWTFRQFPSLVRLYDEFRPPELANVACLAAMLDGDRGGDIIDALQNSRDFPPTVFVAFGAEPTRIVAAVQAGAVAVIEAVSYAGEVRSALAEAVRRSESRAAQRELRTRIAAGIAGVRGNEAAVFEQLLRASSSGEIAERLKISKRNVELLRAKILRRLNVRSAVELGKLLTAAGIEDAPKVEDPNSD